MPQSLTINFMGTRILLNIQTPSSRGVLQIWSKFTEEHPYRCVVSINLNCRFGFSPVNLLQLCRILFCQKTSGELFLNIVFIVFTANFYFHSFCNLRKREFVKINIFTDFIPHFLF